MKRFLLAGFSIWALFLSGATCARTNQLPQDLRPQDNRSSQSAPKENQPMAPSVLLTQAHVSDSFPIDVNAIPKDAQVIQVPVTKVENPAATQVSIYVYLSSPNQAGRKEQQKLLGSFSLYPADRGGKFIVNASEAVRLLKTNDAAGKSSRLVFELKRIHEDKPWTPVEITIEQPRWESGKG